MHPWVFMATQDPGWGAVRVVALDAEHGDEVWRVGTSLPLGLLGGGNRLFVGETNRIKILDPQTGRLERDEGLWGAGPLYSMQYADGQVFALTGSTRSLIYDPSTGDAQFSKRYLPDTPFLIEEGILYFYNLDGYQAEELESHRLLWKHLLPEPVQMRPLFTEDLMVLITVPGHVYALDRATGELAWSISPGVVGNISEGGSSLYFLTADGRLMAVDEQTGHEVLDFKISAVPFGSSTSEWISGAFNVWVDSVDQVAIVALGDRCQVLALQLLGRP